VLPFPYGEGAKEPRRGKGGGKEGPELLVPYPLRKGGDKEKGFKEEEPLFNTLGKGQER